MQKEALRNSKCEDLFTSHPDFISNPIASEPTGNSVPSAEVNLFQETVDFEHTQRLVVQRIKNEVDQLYLTVQDTLNA